MATVEDRWFRTVDGAKVPTDRHGAGLRWMVRYRSPDGASRRKSFRKRVEADQYAVTVEADKLRGGYIDPNAGNVTLTEYARQWERAQVGSSASAVIIDNALRLHLLPALGERPLRSVRRSDVQHLVRALAEDKAPGTVRNIYEVTAKVFAAAVYDRLITHSPCERITLPKAPDAEVVPPTVADVAALADAIAPRYRAAVVLLAGSGLRIGELLGAKVSDVDFLRRTIRVERQRLQSGAVAAPKTARSVRTVPLGGVVVDRLAAHLAAYPSSEWLFTQQNGAPVPYRQWTRAWRPAVRAAGLAEEMTTHDLRHLFASALIAGGASVKQVQTVLGHSSAVITLRVYSHLWPGDEDRTRGIIDAALADAVCPECAPAEDTSSIAPGQKG